jgi:hypothetical protein
VRPSRLTLAAIAFALALVAVLLAHDVRAWRDAFARDDLAFAAAPGRHLTWSASTILPGDPAAALLGPGDDRTLRRGVRLFVFSYRTGLGFDNGFSARRLRGLAEAALAGAAQDPDPRHASQAYDLAGLLAFADASSASGNRSSAASTDRAVTDLQNAVHLDGTNEDAKVNLELLLRLLVAHGSRPGPTATSGPHATGRHGAGSGTPGSGY